MKLNLILAFCAAFALCTSAYPSGDVDSVLDAAGDIYAKEKKNVADMIEDVEQDDTETDKLLADLKAAGDDKDKIRAALFDGNNVVNREQQQVEDFENSWNQDKAAGDKLAAAVEAGNVPSDDVAYAEKVADLQDQADAVVDALEKGADEEEDEGADLEDDLDSDKDGDQLLQDAEDLQQDAEDGGKQFVDAMEGLQQEGDDLEKEA